MAIQTADLLGRSERVDCRLDGTETDFSYIDAAKGKPKGRSQDFYNACCQAVSLDLILAKKQAFSQYGDDQGGLSAS